MRNLRVIPALVLLTAVCSPAWAQDYSVTIEPGLAPRMSPSAVAGLKSTTPIGRTSGTDTVSGRSADAVSEVTSVECVDGAKFRSAFTNPAINNGAPIWIVRMNGRFVSHHTGPGKPSRTVSSAFYVVDDLTGEILAYGSEGDQARPSRAPDVNRLTKGR